MMTSIVLTFLALVLWGLFKVHHAATFNVDLLDSVCGVNPHHPMLSRRHHYIRFRWFVRLLIVIVVLAMIYTARHAGWF